MNNISDRYNQIWSSVLITGITDISDLYSTVKFPRSVTVTRTVSSSMSPKQHECVLWTLKEKELENWMQLLRKNSELSVFYHLVLRGEIKE